MDQRKSQEKLKNILNLLIIKIIKICGCSKSSGSRENSHIRKDEGSDINNLSFHFEKLGKEKQFNPKQAEKKEL